jgi:hypothetical protein
VASSIAASGRVLMACSNGKKGRTSLPALRVI